MFASPVPQPSSAPEVIQAAWPILDQLISGVLLIDCETRTIVYANQVALDMINRNPDQVIGRVCHEFICPAQRQSCPILDCGKSVDFSEKVLIGQDSVVPVLKRVTRISLENRNYLLESFTDISAQKAQENLLRDIGLRDPLTGLLNRTALLSAIEQELKPDSAGSAQPAARPATLLMVSLDNFRQIMDRFGCIMADEILVEFAQLTQAAVRRRDHVFRWGGAIFLIWAPETDPDAALRLANQLRMTVDHHEFPGVGKASISCGLATHRPGESFSDWLARVDFSLNRAQSDGQNSCFSWEAFWRGDSPNFRILWQPAWESGQEQIDREHQALIRCANLLIRQYLYQYDPAMVALDLPQFVTMIRDHFAHEEEILAAMHYPELDDHRQIHQQLLAADEQYARQYENGEVTLMQAMEHLIGDTIVYHMLNDDRRFFHWIRTSGPL